MNHTKNYVFYEHNNEYIPLKIILNNVAAYYRKFKITDAKGMGFEPSGKAEDKIYDIFENIKEKSNIDSINYAGQSDKTGFEYLRTTVSDRTLFEIDDYRIVPSEKTTYSCNVILQIQSAYHSPKDKDEDVVYYLQVLLDQCCYELFVNAREIDPHLKREKKADSCLRRKKKSEPELEPEFESEFEDTTFDE